MHNLSALLRKGKSAAVKEHFCMDLSFIEEQLSTRVHK